MRSRWQWVGHSYSVAVVTRWAMLEAGNLTAAIRGSQYLKDNYIKESIVIAEVPGVVQSASNKGDHG